MSSANVSASQRPTRDTFDAVVLEAPISGLNALGVSPRDLITILQALRGAGALQAEIEVQ